MSEQAIPTRKPLTKLQATETESAEIARMLYIDNMRVLLITLVILGHMAITYGAPFGQWYYQEKGEASDFFTIIMTLLLGIGASFLLGLFYMIAGYFTPRALDRKGATQFVRERLIRLGIPLLTYIIIINPLVTYWAAVHGGYVGSFLHYVPTHLPNLQNASVGPLWFVEALMIFSIAYAVGRLLFRIEPDYLSGWPVQPTPTNRTIVLFALGLGLITFLVRIWAPFGWWWEPLHQEPAHLPQYIALFAVGILAYRHNWFSLLPTKQGRIWGWVALALVPGFPALAVVAGALRGEFDPAIAGGLTWLSLAYSLWESFIGTALVVAVLVWFRERQNRQGALMRGMSASAYAVYVLHPLLIVPGALALSRIQMQLELKFVLFAPLAVATCFLAAHIIRTIPLIRRVL